MKYIAEYRDGKLGQQIAARIAAEAALACLRAHPLGLAACRIGAVTADPHCFAQMQTRLGGMPVVDWLSGEQLPRIC
jgi:hydrogenase expression/formation protein HypE